MEKDVFQEMGERWPSAVVARTEIEKFTGGMLTRKYMANLDSLKMGCERITCGRKVAYRLRGPNGLVSWLRNRSFNSKP